MFRRIVSLTGLFSFVLLVFTSVVLYFEPEGRVAYWADWSFLGMSKVQWGDLHLTLGTLFLLAGCFHIYCNWTPIITYMKNRARKLVVLTPPFVFALLLTLFVAVGTLLHLPPMKQVIDLGEHFKQVQAETYGNPPYGHAELSTLRAFSRRMGFNLEKALENLRSAGLATANADMTLKELAGQARTTPKRIYEIMRGEVAKPTEKRASGKIGSGSFSGLPAEPPPGMGKASLSRLAKDFGLDPGKAAERLENAGVAANTEMTIKEIAAENGMEPLSVYTTLRTGKKP